MPPLHSASDLSAIFLTVLAGRTVKKSLSPLGPGFESRGRRQKGHRSIITIHSLIWQVFSSNIVNTPTPIHL